jgi:hypothetical protein
LNIRLPLWVPAGFAALFVACIFIAPGDSPSPVWWRRSALAIVIFGGVVAIELSQYLSFNPVGSNFIFGVQGRYFVPFAAVAAFALSNTILNRPPVERFCKVAGAVFVVTAHLCTFFVLARAAGKI